MKELKGQFGNALLVILTVAAVVCAGYNYQQQSLFKLPHDGVTWLEREVPTGKDRTKKEVRVVASHLGTESPAARAGIRKGDILQAINNVQVVHAEDVAAVLFRIGAFSKTKYTLVRGGVEFDANVILDEAPRDRALYRIALQP